MKPVFVNCCRLAVLVIVASVTASCRDMGPDIPVNITFARSNTTYPSPPPSIQATVGGISVTAGYWMGACVDLLATARREGDLIEVTVYQKARRLPANISCPALLASFNYVVSVTGLGPGKFHVRVEQVGEGSGRNGFVADETVIVE
jgi:hypothetical protein